MKQWHGTLTLTLETSNREVWSEVVLALQHKFNNPNEDVLCHTASGAPVRLSGVTLMKINKVPA